MKKIYLVGGLMVMLLLVGCNNKDVNTSRTLNVDDKIFTYSIDANYYGNVTIGKSTIDMLSSSDMLEEAGMEQNIMTAFGLKDEITDDKFEYRSNSGDDYYSVEFWTYNGTYEDMGCKNCDTHLSNYIKLPKNITYNSTISDVIDAYGEPVENDDYSDSTYKYSKNINGERFGELSVKRLKYEFDSENVYLYLRLLFRKDTEKLYNVYYEMKVKKND